MDWDSYRYFLACARSKSVRAASQKLGVSHSTVLRKLNGMEHELGARLFDRDRTGFGLTRAGNDVLLGAEDMEDSLQSIKRLVTGTDDALEGLVKVSMPDMLARHILVPDIAQFKKQFPGIRLKIDLSYSPADLYKGSVDIALRFTNEPQQDLVGRYVGKSGQAAYATKEYLQEYDPFLEDSTAQWIAWGIPSEWIQTSPFPHIQVFGIFDNILLQMKLVNAGMGIGMLPTILADKEKNLIRISEVEQEHKLWVLYHRDLRSISRVKVVRDFFLESLQRHFFD